MFITKKIIEISKDVKFLVQNIKRLEPKIKKIRTVVNPLEDLFHETRNRGNTEYLLRCASANPEVIIVTHSVEHSKKLLESYRKLFPGKLEPFIVGESEYKHRSRQLPQFPVVLDMSLFNYRDETKIHNHIPFF